MPIHSSCSNTSDWNQADCTCTNHCSHFFNIWFPDIECGPMCECKCICVSGHVYSLGKRVALLLPLVATDVQWQNRDVIAVSIDFIYKGEKRIGLVLACVLLCAHSWGFGCDKQWNNGTNVNPVDCNYAHTYDYTHTFITRTEGHRPLIEPDGRKFSFSWPSQGWRAFESLLMAVWSCQWSEWEEGET